MRITRQLIKQNTPVTVTYGDRWVLRRQVTVSITRRCSGGRSLLIHIVQRILSVVPWGNIIFMQLIVNYTEFVCKTILVRRRRPCPLNMYASASKNTKVPLHRVLAVRTYVRHHHRHPYPIPGVGVPAENGVRMNCRFYNVRTRSA